MSIYADKKNGKPTGRWCIDLQGNGERYRTRHDTIEAAQDDEKRVKALWASGGSVQSDKPSEALAVHNRSGTLPALTEAAQGILWAGNSSEDDSWAHIRNLTVLIGPGRKVASLTTSDLDDVVKALKKRGLANGTINRYLSHLRSLLEWGAKRGHLPKMTFYELDWPWQKEVAGRIRWITEAEQEQLKEHLPYNVYTVVETAIESGCRRDELLTILPRDIVPAKTSTGEPIYKFHLQAEDTKTDQFRTVYVKADVGERFLQLVKDGNLPSKRGLRSWWDRARKKMGLTNDPDFVFHATRHTRGTRLADKNVNVRVIQQALGHADIKTTERYTHVTPFALEQTLI